MSRERRQGVSSPIRPACRAPPRTRRRSPGRGRAPPRRRGYLKYAGLARPPGARHDRRDRRGRRSSRRSAARPAQKRRCRCATFPSTPSQAPGRTARSCITASPRKQPQARRRTTVPARFRRPISGRHHRHHPHRRRRRADGREAPVLHAGAEGHDRHVNARFPRARAAWISIRGAHRAVEGRRRLCAWHRPRRRFVSVGSRRTAAHRQTGNESCCPA